MKLGLFSLRKLTLARGAALPFVKRGAAGFPPPGAKPDRDDNALESPVEARFEFPHLG